MNFSRLKSAWFSNLVFIFLFLGLCWYYSYHITFFQPPQSLHTWRQTNGLSITQMYFEHDASFMQPEMQNQMSDGGKSGKTAAEFPIIYYTVAKIWQWFGKAEWMYRLFHLIILFSGIFLLFKILIPLTGNAVKAGFISMLVFTCPMFIFYGPNFLPDAPALAFTFMAWYFLYRFVIGKKDYFLWFSALFFFLAISLKVISASGFIAIGAWVIIESVFLKPDKRLFHFRFRHYLPFILTVILVISWYLYVAYYNNLHEGRYSIMGILPVWELSSGKIQFIIKTVKDIYLREYFSPPLQFITILVWIFMLSRIKKLHPFMGFLLIVMPLSFISVLVLYFEVLEGHDYYLITQMPVLIIVWTAFFIYIRDKKYGNHAIVYILMLGAFALLAHDGRMRHNERYLSWMNTGYKQYHEALTEIGPYLKKWDIKPEDRVICIPDPSINTTLYYMNRKGFTGFCNEENREEILRKQIWQGARYLVLVDTALLKLPVIQKLTGNFVGQYRNIKVYKVSPY
jgi:hypothetical protein